MGNLLTLPICPASNLKSLSSLVSSYIKAGQIGRVRRFPVGGAMTIATKHVAGSVNKGDFLALKANTYQLEKTTDKTLTVAQVLEVCDFNGQPSYYIEFIK